jgi:serine/threonine protein kinase
MKQPQLSVDLAPHEQQLGKYRLVAKLGQGGMGTVYLAMASGLGAFRKLLVVKELRHDLPWRESSLSMFMDEAQLAARLDHPNVLQTFEAGEADGRYFLAMEYLDGQPLSSLIDNGIPLELHVHVLCEVLQGLQYAHDLTDYDGTRLHVVHRDVSPQNVFVTHHGQVKVVDFGVAKANNGSNITSPGVFKGKFAYAAPEQLLGRPVDGRCDVFAVGVMLWEAIACRRFGVPKPTVDAFRVRTQGLEPKISQLVPDVDPLLAEICEHALEIDPLQRVESAEALRARLHEWLQLQGEHIDGKQLAAFMRERFDDERAVRRRVIERAMVDAGASQSTVAELPRELLERERESGMSPRIEHESQLRQDSQQSSSSGISPSPRAHAHQAQPAQRRDADSQHHSVAHAGHVAKGPTISHADESVHMHNPRLAARLKQPSRLSGAAILVLVAGGVFALTFQLSRNATEPGMPQLRAVTQPGASPEAPAHASGAAQPGEALAPAEPARPSVYGGQETSRSAATREPASRDSASRDARERDSASRDARERDGRERDVGTRDSASRDARERDSASRDARERDSASRDARERDSASRDGRERERDSASRDARERDIGTATRDARERDIGTATRDARERDSALRDSASRDARERDIGTATRDARERDSASRDTASRDARERDSASRDWRERDARDSATRDARDTASRSARERDGASDSAARSSRAADARERDGALDSAARSSRAVDAREPAARGSRDVAARELENTRSAQDTRESGASPGYGSGARTPSARATRAERSGDYADHALPRTAATPSTDLAAPVAPTKPATITAESARPRPMQERVTTPTTAKSRAPATRAEPGMGGDLRQLRSNGPSRIDTEDPYQ